MRNETIEIPVTQAHIDNGIRRGVSLTGPCMVELALREFTNSDTTIGASLTIIEGKGYEADTITRRAIFAFDRGEPVEPFTARFRPFYPEITFSR